MNGVTPLAQRTMEKTWLTDRCRIWAPPVDGKGVLDRGTGTVTPPAPILIYDGICHVGDRQGNRTVEEEAARVQLHLVLVKIPLSVTNVEAGHEVEVYQANDDASLEQRFEISRALSGTTALTRQLHAFRQVQLPSKG